MAGSKRKKKLVQQIDPKQLDLLNSIFRDMSKLTRLRRKSPFSLAWADVVNFALRGDPAPNSATVSFPSGGGVKVTVSVESGRTAYALFATQDTATLGDDGTEKAYSASTPSYNQLSYTFPASDVNVSQGIAVQLTFEDGGTQTYEILFSAAQVSGGTEVTLAMNPV